MFAEQTAVGWQNLRGHSQRHAGKGQESDFGNRPSCPSENTVSLSLSIPRNQDSADDVNRAQLLIL
jgi:hypothetical protein